MKTENPFSETRGPRFRNLIGGEWRDSCTGALFVDENPANTRECVAVFPQSSHEDAKAAIEAASEAQDKWESMTPPQRGKLLYKTAEILEQQKEELARTLTREEGKILPESRVEVGRAIDIFRYFAGEGHRLNGEVIPSEDPGMLLYTQKQPLGIVSIITPWNFPIAIPSWKLAPALICGNVVIFKPASLTPLIGFKIVEGLEKAGLPAGVVNFVTGPGSSVGMELIQNQAIDGISFTGSYDVGREIYRCGAEANTMPRLQLEMGGKNPLVVLSDAKLDVAVDITVKGAFGGTGQSCTATSRAIVESAVVDEYTRLLVEQVRRMKIGNGLDQTTEMGPVVSEAELKKDLDYVEIGRKEGAQLAYGGKQLKGAGYDSGHFMEPTIFVNVKRDMRIAREEIFGPVLSIITANDFNDALQLANDAEYGLAASICTNSLERAHAFVQGVQAGVVKVNRPTTGIFVQAPFGGMKKSSSMTFKEQGKAAIDFYTFSKSVYMGVKG